MNILIGCEYSAVVRTAFENKGHNAWSCDLLPSERDRNHFKKPIENVLTESEKGKWDLIALHLPCTAVALCGNRHYGRGMRFHQKRLDAIRWTVQIVEFAQQIAPMVYYENPANIMGAYIGRKTQSIQPWQFGHPEQKETWLWLWGLEPLRPTNIVYNEMMQLPKNQRERIFHMPPAENRGLERSRTYTGIAAAMADQWG